MDSDGNLALIHKYFERKLINSTYSIIFFIFNELKLSKYFQIKRNEQQKPSPQMDIDETLRVSALLWLKMNNVAIPRL